MSNEVLDKIQQVKLEKDTKIIPENIKLNETIFGIEGQLEGDVGLGTTLLYLENQVQVLSTAINGKAGISTDATAEASDILIGQTAYVNGQKITGIMPNNGTLNYSPSVGVQNIPSGYTTGGIISGVTSSIDPNITAENIKNGVNILGVVGNLSSGIDTSDANAIASDILEGKTAYVNGVKLTGTMENLAEVFEVPENTHISFENSTFTNAPKMSTSNVTDMSRLFYNCSNLVEAPNYDTINVTDMSSMFAVCFNVVTIPNYNTSNVINMCEMFGGTAKLTSVPNFDTSKVVNMVGMFAQSPNFTTVPNFDTSNVTGMSGMFSGCYNLTNVPQLNTSKVTNMSYMFAVCNNLSNESIQNIVNMCLNSNITTSTYKNLNNTNQYSPLAYSKFDSSYYMNRWTDLSNAGWSY